MTSVACLLRLRVVLLSTMLLSVLACVVLVTTWLIFDEPGRTGEYWLVSLLLVAAFSFSSLLCVNLLCRSRYRVLMWTGVAASLAACVLWNPLVDLEALAWRSGFTGSTVTLAATVATVIAAWCALFAAFHAQAWVSVLGRIAMHTTLVLGLAIGGMAVYAVVYEPWSDAFYAVLGILSMLAGCSLLTSMAMAMMSRVRTAGTGETISGNVRVSLTCPRCDSSQMMRTGLSRCTNCGLRMEINVEEPVCVCGYQLYQLTGTTCPECGREIPEQDRWAVHAAPAS